MMGNGDGDDVFEVLLGKVDGVGKGGLVKRET